MYRADPNILREDTVPILQAHIPCDQLHDLLPVAMEVMDPLSATESSRGALIQLENGTVFVAIYGDETETLLIQAPRSESVANVTNAILSEIPLQPNWITWRAEATTETKTEDKPKNESEIKEVSKMVRAKPSSQDGFITIDRVTAKIAGALEQCGIQIYTNIVDVVSDRLKEFLGNQGKRNRIAKKADHMLHSKSGVKASTITTQEKPSSLIDSKTGKRIRGSNIEKIREQVDVTERSNDLGPQRKSIRTRTRYRISAGLNKKSEDKLTTKLKTKEVSKTYKVTLSSGDDLTKIDGIGPKIAQILKDSGVETYSNLANADSSQIKEILIKAGSRYRMADLSSWSKQALMAKKGDWDGLNKLKGHKRVI